MTPSGYPVYGANGRIGFYSEYTHEHPTLMITCRGATCGTINLSVPFSYIGGNAMALDQLDTKRVDIRYMRYCLEHRGLTDAITGAAQPQITRQNLARVEIPLPGLSEQRRIATILDKAHELRRKRVRAINLLDGLPSSIFLEMFGAGQDFEVRPLSSFVDEDDRINYGVVQPGDEVADGVNLVRVSDLKDGRVSHSSLRKVSKETSEKHNRSILRGNEILISCVGSIGEVAITSPQEKGFNIARAVARVPVVDEPWRLFVAEYLRSPAVQRYFTKELRTVSQPTLNIKQISETLIPIPPMSELLEFKRRIELVQSVAGSARASLESSNILFSSLQHRAFSGQL